MEPEPPLPIAARFLTGPERVEVDFDRRLTPGEIDKGNWSCRKNDVNYLPGLPAHWYADLKTCSGPVGPGLPDPGPDKVKYDPPPFDVTSRSFAEPAAAFDDFPMA